ncbi:HAMP domain-containing protein [Mucilaginibacter daejeonensis]|uniref:sensor histidine kinase n=1 Tax=Mucilaginibacter daejeonensis TaxID=398049 RepID=UPI001D1740EA|nr:ATP-binding protein [Mucilaginibacter daejeonensis]UEG54764.1 HAMP domain-containing protein [Mucilaginibacter daejeonensis]
MKIKTKLRLGFGFLFTVVIFFGALSLFYINEIAKSSRVILKDNYESLRYVREMRKVLDEEPFPLYAANISSFKVYLEKEHQNITEPGEQQAVAALTSAFKALTRPGMALASVPGPLRAVRSALLKIEDVNMKAIVRKNDAAQASVQRTILLLGLAGTFTFLLLFSFSVNFPTFISDPLRKLQDGIAEITKQNYSARLDLPQNDEFADVARSFNSMATRLTEWENSNLANVLSDKRRIEAIIEQMNDAIIGVDEMREILFLNSSAREILNLGDKKTEGQNIDELSKGNDLLKSMIGQTTAGKPFKIVIGGKEAHFRLETREISVPNMNIDRTEGLAVASKPAGKVYILENITEFKERDLAKTNFIATISHELKTPISSIKMSLKLLTDERVGPLNPEQQQLMDHIAEDSARLLKITSELLELSQVETGSIQLNYVPAEPRKIVDHAAEAIRFQAEQKRVEIEVRSDADMPKVQVDVEKTAWVLVNFLSNALRYSPERSKVLIELKKLGGMIEFSVRDQGKGIEEQFQKRLFDRYFQVPTDGQNRSGSGLGLAISKDFIEVQQGTIGVQSALGEGSRFYFTLPAVQA